MIEVRQVRGQSRPVVDCTDERLVAYALAVEAIFGELRAIIGQLSGTLILLQARRARDLSDLPAIARERRDSAVERIAYLNPPGSRLADHGKLHQAVAHIDAAIAEMRRMTRERSAEQIASASARLAAAYRLMQDICDHRIGLTMVDTSNACCTCGKKLA